jgi:hypothetical protein
VIENTSKRAKNSPTGLIIHGDGFDPTAAGNAVLFNLGAVGTVTAATATQLTVTLSEQPISTGPLTVVVTSFGGSSGDPVQVATVVDPARVTANPVPLARTARTLLIRGLRFDPTAAGNAVAFNLGTVGTVTAATATQLTVSLSAQPISTGPLTVVVTSFGGSSGAAVQVATAVDSPTITANSARMARNAPGLMINVVGFDPMAADSAVSLNLGAAGTVVGSSMTQITVSLSAQPISTGPLMAVVTCFGGSSGDAVQVATVVDGPNVTASSARLFRTEPTVLIRGSGFDPTAAGNAVAFNMDAAGLVTAATATQLTVTLSRQPTSAGMLVAVVTYRAYGGTSGAPVQVATVVEPPIVVSGDTHSCAKTVAGQWRCFGSNLHGELDLPSNLGGGEVEALSLGTHFTLALRRDGRLFCFGACPQGQPEIVQSVSAGRQHACAITPAPDLRAVCWGDNTYSRTDTSSFSQLRFKTVAAASRHSCGISTTSGLVCWGDNTYGESGIPDGLGTVYMSTTLYSVALGDLHTCVSLKDGPVLCWGLHSDGKMKPPSDLDGQRVKSLTSGAYFVCAHMADGGRLRCWGDNLRKQTDIPADLGGVISVSAGTYHVCAVRLDGSIWCVSCWFLRCRFSCVCCAPLVSCSCRLTKLFHTSTHQVLGR